MSNTDNEDMHEEFLEKKFRKEEKKHRKIIQKKDRSKFKKTQKTQEKVSTSKASLQKGLVISVLRNSISVLSDKTTYNCTMKGSLEQKSSLDKTLIHVGDHVQFSVIDKTIYHIEPRTSILSRQELLRKKQQIIAVNIDQVLITVSVVQPKLKPSLIDRYIIAAEKGNMVPIIIVNKIDLLHDTKHFSEKELEKEHKKYQELLSAYALCGYPVLSLSSKTNEGIESLLSIMKGKSSVFSGQSGVGKTSLINIITKNSLKTGEVVKKTYKGAHVTTKANLIPLTEGGACIDTPGIKSFGIWDVKKEDLSSHFKEIAQHSKHCKFKNCSHTNEPECAVIEAVNNKKISSLRFESYRSLMKNYETKKTR
jgi:ribosome biogenesis GTPase